jgi:hypothetical protein
MTIFHQIKQRNDITATGQATSGGVTVTNTESVASRHYLLNVSGWSDKNSILTCYDGISEIFRVYVEANVPFNYNFRGEIVGTLNKPIHATLSDSTADGFLSLTTSLSDPVAPEPDTSTGVEKIIYSGEVGGGQWHLIMYDVNDFTTTDLTPDAFSYYDPVLYDDYSKIVFASNREGSNIYELYTADISISSGLTNITKITNLDVTGSNPPTNTQLSQDLPRRPSWNSTGEYIIYSRSLQPTGQLNGDTSVVKLSDLSDTVVTTGVSYGKGGYNFFSSDTRMLYSGRGAAVGNNRLRTCDVDLSTLTFSNNVYATGSGSGTDRQLATLNNAEDGIVFRRAGDVYKADFDGTGISNEADIDTGAASTESDPSYSPDETFTTYQTNLGGDSEIYYRPVDKSQPRFAVTNNSVNDVSPAWGIIPD